VTRGEVVENNPREKEYKTEPSALSEAPELSKETDRGGCLEQEKDPVSWTKKSQVMPESKWSHLPENL